MEIDKKIETPFGLVHFKGNVSQEEFDHIIELGLMVLFSQGRLGVEYEETEEEMDTDGPGPEDIIQ